MVKYRFDITIASLNSFEHRNLERVGELTWPSLTLEREGQIDWSSVPQSLRGRRRKYKEDSWWMTDKAWDSWLTGNDPPIHRYFQRLYTDNLTETLRNQLTSNVTSRHRGPKRKLRAVVTERRH